MLCGPHPNSNAANSKFYLDWYQVLSIEGRDTKLNSEGTSSPAPGATEPERRLIVVRGAKWPWQPGTGSSTLSNNLCVGIFRGAVAVHTKTITMEGRGTFAADIGFGNGGDPEIHDPPWR
jgi:hypothetical protein